jgi:hypothetical protein
MDNVCSTKGRETGNAYRILVRKSEEKNPLRKPRGSLLDNIQMDLRKIL